jgi:hypothetical protein
MSEESRLGREAIETGYVLKQIMDAGVRVFFYLEDRERTLDTAMDKVMLSLTNFASEVEREKARQRTYDAMFRKAKALHVTGGKVYGYENVDVPSPEDNGTRLRVVRHINEEQAAIIRRVFELYASGVGMVKIAHRLNQEGVKPPRGRGWAPSGIREMLHRELYRGLVVWNGVRRSSGLEPKSSGRGISRSGSRRPGRPAATAMRQATGAVGFKAPLQPPHLAQAEPQGLSSLARGDPATTRGLYQSGTLQLLPAQREGLHGGRTFSRSSYPRTFSCSSSNSSASR